MALYIRTRRVREFLEREPGLVLKDRESVGRGVEEEDRHLQWWGNSGGTVGRYENVHV